MSLTKYYGTGEYFKKELPSIHRFKENQSSIDVSARIYQRNNVMRYDDNPKKIISIKHDKKVYKRQWDSQNKFSDKESYYKHPRKARDIKQMTSGNFNDGYRQEFNHIYPANPSALKIVRRQIFSQNYKKPSEKAAQHGRTMNKSSYKAWKEGKKIARSKSSKANKNYLDRKCLYMTKPLLRLNKDFYKQELVKNSQAESKDQPQWMFNKEYDQPRMSSKMAKKLEADKWKNCDIFGLKKDRFKKVPPAFRVVPPHSGMRYEKNRMVVLPEGNKKERKFYSIFDKTGKRKSGMIGRIQWKDVKMNKFDWNGPRKIGNSNQPWIEKLQSKQKKIPIKIGKGEVTLRGKQEMCKIKIGHVY